jgi:aminoglycoside phosphotransferase (APT) family kinase protein
MVANIIDKAYPGSQIVRSWPLKGGIVADVTAVIFQTPDQQQHKVVVRQHETAVYEFQVLNLLRAFDLKTAEPLFLDEDIPALVMSFIEGGIDFGSAGDGAGYARQMAERLAAIHNADFSTADFSFLKVRGGLCIEPGRMAGAGQGAGFDTVQVESIVRQGPPDQANQPRLLQGDFWGGNMLWRDGQLVGVIDWEDAGLGEPLKDLAEARVELIWLFGVGAADHFLTHYRSRVALDYTNLAYWDLCATLRLWRLTGGDWSWLVNFVGEYGRSDITASAIQSGYKLFVEQALRRLNV